MVQIYPKHPNSNYLGQIGGNTSLSRMRSMMPAPVNFVNISAKLTTF